MAISAYAQETEFSLEVPTSEDTTAAYVAGIHSGARAVRGPYDLDGDGMMEILVTDYTGGGRVHVIENAGPDTWELVYSTPYLDATAGTGNARIAVGADLDADGNGEILVFCGWGYSEDNAVVPSPGLCAFEYTGTDNDYGTAPAGRYDYDGDTPDRSQHEVIEVADVDGDGFQEVLFANNGLDNRYDNWYVVSVTGDIGSGFEAWVEELRLSSRASEDFDPVDRGGGSPFGIVPADLDGDGVMDISMSSWNNFNFTNARATGPDAYEAPGEGDPNAFLQASSEDHVSLFGGVAVDIDGNGDDEVFYPRFQSTEQQVTLLNYEEGEDPLQITPDNVVLDLLSGLANLSVTAGDVNGDGLPELIGAGSGYSADAANAGEPSMFVNIVTFAGGDVEDPANYSVETLNTSAPSDLANFNVIVRDSAGVETTYYESIGDPVFPAKLAYLGDADNDGVVEIAFPLQVPADSITTFDETFDPDSLTGVFNTPVGAAEPGPATQGNAFEFTFNAAPGSYLSFATMFGESNDLFFAPADSGLALFSDGMPRSGDVTSEVLLWDAGTELNEEPGAGPNQAPRQSEPNTGDADTLDTVRLVDDGFTYPDVADALLVTLTPEDGDGATTFTVRIENLTDVTGLSPGVYVIHTDGTPLFTEGAADFGDGLEAIAEDGNPADLAASLVGEFGFFRTVREVTASPDRVFMRIIGLEGTTVSVEDDRVVLPSDYKLEANYPNPFNPTTTFAFTLPVDKAVSVRVYDLTGRLVTTLVDNQLLSKGTHEATWNGTDQAGTPAASGTYLYTLEYGNFRQTRKMVLLK